jgi:hypothetical protein
MRNFQVGGRVPIKPFENLLKIIKLKYRKVGIDEGHAQIAPRREDLRPIPFVGSCLFLFVNIGEF